MAKISSSGDVISGALLGALGVYIVMEARRWTYLASDGPGPGFFPTWYGTAMIVLSLALIANAVARAKTRAPKESIDRAALGRALGTWAAFAGAAVLMKPLGFAVSFALLVFFVVAVVFRKAISTAAITAVCAALAFYVTFALALNVPLPKGLLGF
jgi:putative tricarboxylic transport membrane protein